MKEFAGRRILMLLENNPFLTDDRPRREAQALVRAGYRVSVISPRERGDPFIECMNGVHLYNFPPPQDGSGFLSYAWEYAYATLVISLLSLLVLFREGFDILHLHNPPDSFFALAALYKLLGKRIVYDHHDLAPEMYLARSTQTGIHHKLIHKTLIHCERLTYRAADWVITTNESYKQVDVERGKVPPERIQIVRNGPDLAELVPVPPDPELRKKARAIIGYVGIMGPQDGVDYLLRAFYHLIHRFKCRDFYCVIIGKGSEVPELKQLMERLAIQDYVWFTGWIPRRDMVRYLSTADICVDPDPSNPFTDRSTMVKLMEYMTLGKPVVAFDLPEHRVTAGGAALFARPNDEIDFARKMRQLIDDPELGKQLGDCGRTRVENELTWARQEANLLAAYQKICSRPPEAAVKQAF